MRVYRRGDGTPQIVRPKLVGQQRPGDLQNPQPPCIVLDEEEGREARPGSEARGEAEAVIRRAAFELLAEHPDEDSVVVTYHDAHTFGRYKQTDRLLAGRGVSLARGGRTSALRDYLTEADVLWAFAHHATSRAAADLVDAYTGLVNRERFGEFSYDSSLLYVAGDLARDERKAEGAPAVPDFPEKSLLPDASGMRVATVSEVAFLTPAAVELGGPAEVGMYVVVPADFPATCRLSVGPLLCWAGYADGEGREHHFVASPAETVAAAWEAYQGLAAGPALPSTLVRVEGMLAARRRAARRDDESLPHHLHHCDLCHYLGRLMEGEKRTDLYFCTRRAVPSLCTRYSSRPGGFYELDYHKAGGAQSEAFSRAAELARAAGLTAPFDGRLGEAHDLSGCRDAGDLALAVNRLLNEGRLSGRDAILVATPEIAAVARAHLASRELSGVAVAYELDDAAGEISFTDDSAYRFAKARLIGALDDDRLCLAVEGLGVCAVPADEVLDGRCPDEEFAGPKFTGAWRRRRWRAGKAGAESRAIHTEGA